MTWHKFPSFRSTRGAVGALLAGAGLLLAAVACTVTTDTKGDPGPGTPGTGGMGGDGSGGSNASTGGSTTGGNGGDNGSETAFDCHEDNSVQGTLASTEPNASDDDCWACIKQECPDEFAACHAVDPYSVCGYSDVDVLGGEIDCIFQCFDQLAADEIFAGIQEDIDDCAAECGGTAACGTSSPSPVTIQLAACTIALEGGNGCQVECGWQEE